jgi:hypothetical protein
MSISKPSLIFRLSEMKCFLSAAPPPWHVNKLLPNNKDLSEVETSQPAFTFIFAYYLPGNLFTVHSKELFSLPLSIFDTVYL